MDGLIAVCHFCEQHGPNVVFTTQAHHKRLQHPNWDAGQSSKCPISDEQNAVEGCSACIPIPAQKSCFVSNSEDECITYTSSRLPLSHQLATLLKRACVRSLSCEVCPEEEGSVYFGDDTRGHVLSYTFSVKDVHARGLKRWYSIVIVVRDHVYLLTAWSFLVKNLESMVKSLKERALQVFNKDGGGRNKTHSDQPRKHKVTSRGLAELLELPEVWERLHTAHVWLMMAAGKRLEEVLGTPSFSSTSLPQQPPTPAAGDCLHDHNNERLLNVAPLTARCFLALLGSHQFEVLLQHLLLGFPLLLRCSAQLSSHQRDFVCAKLKVTLKGLIPPFLHGLITAEHQSPASPTASEGLQDSKRSSLSKVFSSEYILHDLGQGGPNSHCNDASPSSRASLTLTSSPSVEVYDALDLDTLVLSVTHEGGGNTAGAKRVWSGREDATHTQFNFQGVHLSSKVPHRHEDFLNFSSNSDEFIKQCIFKVEEGTGRAPSARKVCTLLRDLISACGNSALRDDTLALTLQHNLEQWRCKARLWGQLVTQHRSIDSSISSSVVPSLVADDKSSAAKVPVSNTHGAASIGSYTFTAPPILNKLFQRQRQRALSGDSDKKARIVSSTNTTTNVNPSQPLPPKIDDLHKLTIPALDHLKPSASLGGLRSVKSAALLSSVEDGEFHNINNSGGAQADVRSSNRISLYPKLSHFNNRDASKCDAPMPSTTNIRVDISSSRQQSSPIHSAFSTYVFPPSAHCSVGAGGGASVQSDISVSVGVAPAVLQKMLLAVGATECDIPLLQSWAFNSTAI